MFNRPRPLGFLCLLFTAGALCAAPGDSANKKAEPDWPALSPEASMDAMHLDGRFEVELVAAEPMVKDPTAIAWGADGRLWVVEMTDYPVGIDNEGKPGGRVRFLEDTDGDGTYDESTVFLKDVPFPNGILPWRDGVIVTAAPRIFYAEDTDGDGKADKRKPLYTGFTEANTQLRVNGLRRGLDNWVYVANGLRHKGKVKSVKTDETVDMSGRDLRVRPDTGALEPVSGASQFVRFRDDAGHWFGVHNSYPLWHYVLPDRYTRRNPHVAAPDGKNRFGVSRNPPVFRRSEFIRRYDHPHRGSLMTSACGPCIYRDNLLFPHGRTRHSFTCEPQQNLVHHRVLEPNGASFTAERPENEQHREFLASEDNWFRPVMARTGPDGALWVVDMYRYLIEHPQFMPSPNKEQLAPFYRTGHDRGRIYRIYPKDSPPRDTPTLADRDTGELVAALKSPNGWVRDTAQQLLIWADDEDVISPLKELAQNGESHLARLHALCTLEGLDTLTPKLLAGALIDKHPAVRRRAILLAEPHIKKNPGLLANAGKLYDDPSAHVRLQLAFSLGEWDDDRAGEILGDMAARAGNDRYMRAAIMSSAEPHYAALVDAVAESGADAGGPMFGDLLTMSLAQQNRGAMAQLLEVILTPAAEDDAATAADGAGYTTEQFNAFADWRRTLARQNQTIAKLRKRKDDALAEQLGRVSRIYAAAREIIADDFYPVTRRVAAARLIGWQGSKRAEELKLIEELLGLQTPTEVQVAGVKAMRRIHGDAVPRMLLESWSGHVPEVRNAIVETLRHRAAWVGALLDAIEAGRVAPADISASHRRLLQRQGKEEARRRAKELLADASAGNREKVIEKYRPAIELTGDAESGKQVFAENCAVCHKVAGVGQSVGPNLLSITDRSPSGLLTGILAPNQSIEPRYMAYTVTTESGEAHVGIITAETGNSITLRGLDGKATTLLRNEIESLNAMNRSLMPVGLEANMSEQDLADLIRFLRHPNEADE